MQYNKLRLERKLFIKKKLQKTLTSEYTSQVFFDNLQSEQNMKIYKWGWYIVFSRREERDVAQGQEGLVKGCI